jgi:hypothetical protein
MAERPAKSLRRYSDCIMAPSGRKMQSRQIPECAGLVHRSTNLATSRTSLFPRTTLLLSSCPFHKCFHHYYTTSAWRPRLQYIRAVLQPVCVHWRHSKVQLLHWLKICKFHSLRLFLHNVTILSTTPIPWFKNKRVMSFANYSGIYHVVK